MTPHRSTPTSWSGTRRSFPTRTARTIIQRDGHTCQLQLPDCTHQATEADHIVNHAHALQLGWTPAEIDDAANGQAVCASCHRQKTQAEQAAGRAQAAQRKPRRRPRPPHPGLRTD